MDLSRRDFLKLFGISVASLLLTRCKAALPGVTSTPTPTVSTAMPPTTVTPAPPDSSARGRLRHCWYSFDQLARQAKESGGFFELTPQANESGSIEKDPVEQLRADHRAALDELVARGEISTSVADLVQEAYDAAIRHVWRDNIFATCYLMAGPNFKIDIAQNLVTQSEALEQIATQGTIDPATLANARTALEHDLTFFTLTKEEIDRLYESGLGEHKYDYVFPTVEALHVNIPPDARAAAQFILDLLTGK